MRLCQERWKWRLWVSMPEITPAEAAQELLRRRHARRNLLDFTKYTFPKFRAAPHHELIAEKLDAVLEGKIDRLMIFMPPRHGKSELASVRLPAYALGKYPDIQIACASYGGDLAKEFGRKVKGGIQDPKYQKIFPGVQLRQDSKAADRMNTAKGAYIALGVGGPFVGKGANIILIDDPLKGREQADSEPERKTVIEWYQGVARNRLEPYEDAEGNRIHRGAIIIIQTRWHEEDLAGYILETKRASEWEVLELKAIENEGTDNEIALWPDRYPLEELHALRDDSGPREWSALFQQQPQPDDGTFFTRDMIRWYDPGEQPDYLHTYGASDYATVEDRGDFTEHGILGLDEDENIYALDWWYGQTTSDVWINKKLELVNQYRPLVWVGEGGVIKNAVEPFLNKMMQERGLYQLMEWINPVRDKTARARAIQSYAARRKLYLPRHTPWAERLLAQMLVFPAGRYDDAVDVLSIFGLALDKTVGGKITTPEKGIRKDRYDRAFDRLEMETGTTWKTA